MEDPVQGQTDHQAIFCCPEKFSEVAVQSYSFEVIVIQ
jgi:hypothetical protein